MAQPHGNCDVFDAFFNEAAAGFRSAKKETEAISSSQGGGSERKSCISFLWFGSLFICAYLKRISDFSVMFVFSVPSGTIPGADARKGILPAKPAAHRA